MGCGKIFISSNKKFIVKIQRGKRNFQWKKGVCSTSNCKPVNTITTATTTYTLSRDDLDDFALVGNSHTTDKVLFSHIMIK